MSSQGELSPNVFTRMAHQARRGGDIAAYEAALLLVARHYDLAVDAVKTTAARPLHLARARQVALYLCVTQFNVSRLSLSRITGLDPAGISRACVAVEERRTCALFDREIDELELELIVCT
jgi:chromosomal replication initiation ATPase DnaA